MPYKDPLKAKENAKQYWKKNKDKLLIKTRDWKRKHKKELSIKNKIYRDNNLEKRREYYQKNKVRIIKKERDRYERNKPEIIEKAKKRYYLNRDSVLKKNTLRRYKLTKEEHDNLLSKYRNICPICLKEEKLVVDHCHKTGKIRGLLCGDCNKGLGFFKDSLVSLDRAKKYLL